MDFKYRTWYYDENDKKMKDGQAKIMYGDETYFGNYDLAERLFKVSYTNK